MTTFVFDPRYGIAGDMTVAALIDLGAPQERVLESMRLAAGVLDDIRYSVEEVKKPLAGKRIVDNAKKNPARSVAEMREGMEEAVGLTGASEGFAMACLEKIIAAEKEYHKEPEDVLHLHELGSGDTLADIIGAAVACEELGMFGARVFTLPITTGHGKLELGGHGRVEIPAPATRNILRGWKWEHGKIEGELTTPTGAAILTTLATKSVRECPGGVHGIGFGSRKFSRPTYLRVVRVGYCKDWLG